MALDLTGYARKTTAVLLGGKEFEFSRLSLRDLAQFQTRLAEQHRIRRRQRTAELLQTAKELGVTSTVELLRELDRPPSDDEIEHAAGPVEGQTYLA